MKFNFLRFGIVLFLMIAWTGTAASVDHSPPAPSSNWRTLSLRADSLFEDEQYDSAVTVGEKALRAADEEPAINDTDRVELLLRLAKYHREAARYTDAESEIHKATELQRKIRPDSGYAMARCVAALGEVKYADSRYDEAERLFRKALRWQNADTLTPARDLGRSLAGMGNVLFRADRHLEAESYLQQAIDIQRSHLPKDDPDLALSIARLAMVCSMLGRYDQVEPLLNESIAILRRHYGDDHPRVAQMLGNLGLWYTAQNRGAESIEVLKESLAIRERALGPDNPKLAFALVNLAACHGNEGRNAEALPLFQRAYEIRRKTYGENHLYVAFSLGQLGGCLVSLGRLDSAETVYRQAVSITEALFPADNADVIDGKCQVASLLIRRGRFDSAFAVAHEALRSSIARFHRFAPVMSDYEAVKVSDAMYGPRDLIMSDLQKAGMGAPWRESAVNDILATGGVFNDELFARARSIRMSRDPALRATVDCLNQRLYALQRLGKSVIGSKPDAPTRRKLDSLDTEIRRLEHKLGERTQGARLDGGSQPSEAARIAAALPAGEAVVEFVSYYDQFAAANGQYRFGAVVLRNDTPATVIFLGPASPIDSLVRRYQSHMNKIAAQGHLPTQADNTEYREIGRGLYDRVWQRLGRHLAGLTRVRVCPDGSLGQIAFGTLLDSSGTYLVERYAIDYLDAARDLVDRSYATTVGTGLLAMGDPDFDRSTAPPMQASLRQGHSDPAVSAGVTNNIRASCVGLNSEPVVPLPQTRTEARYAAAAWSGLEHEAVALRVGAAASEDTFRKEAPGKRALHIATHGFAYTGHCQDGEISTDQLSQRVYVRENPLLLSGLLLVGANVDPEVADANGTDDGILSAFEIAEANLDGVELAVLSGCETGLGIAQGHEGIYSVRRAFHMAGVRTVVSSMWPVPDRATSELIRSLYCQGRLGYADGLRRSQLEQIRALRATELADHPFSWGAFVVSGGE